MVVTDPQALIAMCCAANALVRGDVHQPPSVDKDKAEQHAVPPHNPSLMLACRRYG
jgi:hypothetical protein